MPDDTLQFACCDVNSRGVSYADGKIFVGRLDGSSSRLTLRPARNSGRPTSSITSRVRSSPRLRWSSRRKSSRASAAANTASAVRFRLTTSIPASHSGARTRRPARASPTPIHGRATRQSTIPGSRPGSSAPTNAEDQHRLLGHQQSRPVEHGRALDRQERSRQACEPLHGLDHRARRRHRQDQMVGAGNACRRLGTMTASMSLCSPISNPTARRCRR